MAAKIDLLVLTGVTLSSPAVARLDLDGNSVLAAQLSVRHAGDSLRAAELSLEHRARADRHLAIFPLRRAADDRARGVFHRIRIERRRAGEAGGIRALAVEYEPMTDGWYRGLAEAT